MVALLAILLRLLTCLPLKNGCATSYGCGPGNMVASVDLATPKKEIAWPPMVALLAIWLRSLTMVASVNLATAKKDSWAMVALLAISLHPLTCLPQKNGCMTSYGCAPGNMVASNNLATPQKEVAWPHGCAPGNMVAFVNYGCVC